MGAGNILPCGHRAIVETCAGDVRISCPYASTCSAVGFQLVCDQHAQCTGLFAHELAQQSFGSPPFAAALDQGVKRKAILVDGAPKPVLLAVDGDDDFIKTSEAADVIGPHIDGRCYVCYEIADQPTRGCRVGQA